MEPQVPFFSQLRRKDTDLQVGVVSRPLTVLLRRAQGSGGGQRQEQGTSEPHGQQRSAERRPSACRRESEDKSQLNVEKQSHSFNQSDFNGFFPLIHRTGFCYSRGEKKPSEMDRSLILLFIHEANILLRSVFFALPGCDGEPGNKKKKRAVQSISERG